MSLSIQSYTVLVFYHCLDKGSNSDFLNDLELLSSTGLGWLLSSHWQQAEVKVSVSEVCSLHCGRIQLCGVEAAAASLGAIWGSISVSSISWLMVPTAFKVITSGTSSPVLNLCDLPLCLISPKFSFCQSVWLQQEKVLSFSGIARIRLGTLG